MIGKIIVGIIAGIVTAAIWSVAGGAAAAQKGGANVTLSTNDGGNASYKLGTQRAQLEPIELKLPDETSFVVARECPNVFQEEIVKAMAFHLVSRGKLSVVSRGNLDSLRLPDAYPGAFNHDVAYFIRSLEEPFLKAVSEKGERANTEKKILLLLEDLISPDRAARNRFLTAATVVKCLIEPIEKLVVAQDAIRAAIVRQTQNQKEREADRIAQERDRLMRERREEIQRLAAGGDSSAQFTLGEMFLEGYGGPRDPSKAVSWFETAAKQGHPPAQFKLGLIYEYGDIAPRNLDLARSWYQLAADQGHATSQFKLGLIYERGVSISKNLNLALKWYQLAADQGHSVSIENAARLRTMLAEAEKTERLKLAKAEEKRRAAEEWLLKGQQFQKNNSTSWVVEERFDRMTDKKLVIAKSQQRNEYGAQAVIEAECFDEKGIKAVSFSALIVNNSGKPTVRLTRNSKFEIEARYKINETVRIAELESKGYSNKVVLFSALEPSPDPQFGQVKSITDFALKMVLPLAELGSALQGSALPLGYADTVWGVMVELKTSSGDLLLTIPTTHASIQKVYENCWRG